MSHDALEHPPFDERVVYLRNAVRIAQIVAAHPVRPVLWRVVETPNCPVIVYEYRAGEPLHTARELRDSPESVYQRFRALPAAEIATALGEIFVVDRKSVV